MDVNEHPLIAELPSTLVSDLVPRLERVAVDAGTTLMREGEPGVSALLLTHGDVAVRQDSRDADLDVLGPGAIVGELAVLRGSLRTATVVARTDVVAWRAPAEVLWSVLEGSAEARAALEKLVAGRIAAQAPVTEVRVPSGLRLHVRPILPSDREIAPEAGAGFSARSRYLRFFSASLPPERILRQLIEIDYVDHFAWVVLDAEQPGEPYVASGRYIRQDRPLVAELAFGVVDDHQGQGIGKLLLGALAIAARVNGIERFSASALRENAPMLALLQGVGASWRLDGAGVLSTVIPVPDPAGLVSAPAIDGLEKAAALIAISSQWA